MKSRRRRKRKVVNRLTLRRLVGVPEAQVEKLLQRSRFVSNPRRSECFQEFKVCRLVGTAAGCVFAGGFCRAGIRSS